MCIYTLYDIHVRMCIYIHEIQDRTMAVMFLSSIHYSAPSDAPKMILQANIINSISYEYRMIQTVFQNCGMCNCNLINRHAFECT